jgi:DNA-binding PadR family transcriptional regulator
MTGQYPVGRNLMDVKTVCLGMLTDGEASGYDLKKFFESSFGHFFPAGYGSIYPALSTLARNGLVEYELVPQDGKPDRKVYSITDKGRDALMEGLANPNPSHKVRSEFLATLWFAHLMPDEQVDTVVENKLEELDEFLKLIEEFAAGDCHGMGPGAQFVAGFGKHMASSFKQYIEMNRDLLAVPATTEVKSAAG